jgi:two-component system response regulator HydG
MTATHAETALNARSAHSAYLGQKDIEVPPFARAFEGPEERQGRVLVVDDDSTMCEFVEASLRRWEQDVVSCTSARDALELIAEQDFDVILTDLNMQGLGGLELCERIVGMRPNVPVVVVTGQATLDAAIGAIRVGAYDFIIKPVDTKVLALAVSRALQHRRLREEVKRLRQAVVDTQRFAGMLGNSSAMKRVFDLVTRVGDSEATVLITGESGTGKELVARAIHEHSNRRNAPFLAINCAALPPTLLESELFGHARGAFTDAKQARTGLFVQAEGGTLLLDEIGEMPLEMQPKLLRALQERKVRPLGGNAEVPFNVRVLAATNRDLESEVEEKRFREDLYYRIHVVSVEVPPLRERGGDVLLLAQHFVDWFAARAGRQVKGIAAAAADKLLAYNWPGNVRELENCMERAVALMRYDEITVEDLPQKLRSYQPDHEVLAAHDPAELITVDELERRYIQRVLALVSGNKSRAAQILGFDRRTLYRKIERYSRSS